MRVIIFVLKEAGARDVPSFDQLRKTQNQICGKCGVPTLKCESSFGNVFFMNNVRSIIAKVSDFVRLLFVVPTILTLFLKDWANPLVRPHI